MPKIKKNNHVCSHFPLGGFSLGLRCPGCLDLCNEMWDIRASDHVKWFHNLHLKHQDEDEEEEEEVLETQVPAKTKIEMIDLTGDEVPQEEQPVDWDKECKWVKEELAKNPDPFSPVSTADFSVHSQESSDEEEDPYPTCSKCTRRVDERDLEYTKQKNLCGLCYDKTQELPNFDFGSPNTLEEIDEEPNPLTYWKDVAPVACVSTQTVEYLKKASESVATDVKRVETQLGKDLPTEIKRIRMFLANKRAKIFMLKRYKNPDNKKIAKNERKRKFAEAKDFMLIEDSRNTAKRLKTLKELNERMDDEIAKANSCCDCGKEMQFDVFRPLLAPYAVKGCKNHFRHFGCFLHETQVNEPKLRGNPKTLYDVLKMAAYEYKFEEHVLEAMEEAIRHMLEFEFFWFKCECIDCNNLFQFATHGDKYLNSIRSQFRHAVDCLLRDETRELNKKDLLSVSGF